MSDTPRTDAALIDNGELVGQFPEWVMAEFARQLERELAALKDALRNPSPQLIKDCARRLLRFQEGSTDESFNGLQWAEVKQDAARVISELASALINNKGEADEA